MRGPLIEYPADQAHDRHIVDEMFGEQFFPGVGLKMSKALAGIRQHQIALAQLGKSQQLKGFTEVEDLVGLELQAAGENGQVGVAVIGWPRERLDQARQ